MLTEFICRDCCTDFGLGINTVVYSRPLVSFIFMNPLRFSFEWLIHVKYSSKRFPELESLVPNALDFARTVKAIGNEMVWI